MSEFGDVPAESTVTCRCGAVLYADPDILKKHRCGFRIRRERLELQETEDDRKKQQQRHRVTVRILTPEGEPSPLAMGIDFRATAESMAYGAADVYHANEQKCLDELRKVGCRV